MAALQNRTVEYGVSLGSGRLTVALLTAVVRSVVYGQGNVDLQLLHILEQMSLQ